MQFCRTCSGRAVGLQGSSSELHAADPLPTWLELPFDRRTRPDQLPYQGLHGHQTMPVRSWWLCSRFAMRIGVARNHNLVPQVVFRSCKLIPTMVVAFLMHKQRFSIVEILSALAVCGGLVMFALADMSGSTKSSTVLGMSLQAISAVADAFLPNLQQKLFDQGGSPLEVRASPVQRMPRTDRNFLVQLVGYGLKYLRR